jgi:glycerophosphoryl diester phosphodiesterase
VHRTYRNICVTALVFVSLINIGPGAAKAPKENKKAAAVANVAHRGASAYAPEHTFAAYDLALEMGADYIEQDLQLTADGVLVVLHDNTLDRTARGPLADCTGPVITKTLDQIKRCDVGSWFNEAYPEHAKPSYVGLQIPTLEEVFERYGTDVRYYIETKMPEQAPMMEEKLIALIDEYGLRKGAVRRWQVLIQSFSPESLIKIHAIDPELPLIQLGIAGTDQALRAAAEYAVGVGPSFGGVDQEFVEAAHGLCLEVHPYTVNSARDMQEMIDAGVDGMFTNHPDRLRDLLGDGHWSGDLAAKSNRRCRQT